MAYTDIPAGAALSYNGIGGAASTASPSVLSLFPTISQSSTMLGNAASAAGSAVSDQYSAEAAGYQAQGAVYQQQGAEAEVVAMHLAATGATLQGRQDILEEQNYNLAAKYATENIDVTEASTKMQEAAEQRQAFSTIGTQKAGEAGGGLAESGSALDILASSNRQAAYGKAALGFQGGVTEAGFSEQAASNYMMAQAAKKAYLATGITSQEDQQAAIMQQDTAEMYGTEQEEYLAQEQGYKAAATASTASSIISGVGGVIGALGAVASIFKL